MAFNTVFDILRHYVENTSLHESDKEKARELLDAADPQDRNGKGSEEGNGDNAEA